VEECDFIADIEALKHELYLFDAVLLIDQYQQQKAMAALFPTFTAMFRKLGNWLCPDQAPLEAFVVGDFLYWDV
jgi:hypothetical protein